MLSTPRALCHPITHARTLHGVPALVTAPLARAIPRSKTAVSAARDPILDTLKDLVSYFPRVQDLRDAVSLEPSKRQKRSPEWRSPVYAFIGVYLLVFLGVSAVHGLSTPGPAQLSLCLHFQSKSFHWWQVVTSGVVHTDWQHLFQAVFHTYIWGKLLEEQRGPWGLVLVYSVCLLGANLFACAVFAPAKATGAAAATSAAVWLGMFWAGLFLPRVKRKPLEVACLTPFVCLSAVDRFAHLSHLLVVKGVRLGHLVLPAGSLAAALLSVLLFKALDAARAWLEQIEKDQRKK